MRLKVILNNLFIALLAIFSIAHSPGLSAQCSSTAAAGGSSSDPDVQALASLLFHVHEKQELLQAEQMSADTVQFSEKEIDLLWLKAALYFESADGEDPVIFSSACALYTQATQLFAQGLAVESQEAFDRCAENLAKLWKVRSSTRRGPVSLAT